MGRARLTPKAASFEPARMITAALAASGFRELGVGVSTWSGIWHALHGVPDSVIDFEVSLRAELPRWRYNNRAIAKARTERRTILGEHAGFHDLFVPISGGKTTEHVLIAGPFARKRPTSADIVERWYDISHTRASLADSAFVGYMSATLATLTLEGQLLGAFRKLIECLARALSGQGDAEKLSRQWNTLLQQLLDARSADRMWEVARSMVDDRTEQRWWTPIMADTLTRLDMKSPPRHAVVGLLRGRPDEPDPIDEALRRHAFQRAATRLTRGWGGLVCGRVGDHGIVILAAGTSSGTRARTSLVDVAARASQAASRFGFRLHCGIAVGSESQSLADRYRAALAAADRALFRREPTVVAPDVAEPAFKSLTQLRIRLAAGLEEHPDLLAARFERYIEAVLEHAGYALDAASAHLEAGLGRFAEPWLASGQLDFKDFDELCTPIAKGGSASVPELVAAYRAVVAHLERAVINPTVARQDRSVERALAFMRDHLAEPLTLPRVAKVARFAPSHFSRLLRREQGMPFERYLFRLRLERAKHILSTTPLNIGRVAERSGFRSRTHFQQVFRKATGETPLAYRARTRM
jgi:AraC-like DNA-binding protein